jgi:pimeloyl-ACP methyl ester carboxylesterase
MKFLKTLGKILIWLLVLAGLLLLLVYLGQGMLMYPGKGISGTPADWNARLGTAQNRGFAAVYAEGGTEGIRVRALWAQSREGTVPALLWMHGRSEDITDPLAALGPMQEAGFHVLSMEYPGFGDAEGETDEATILAHAEAAFDYLWNRDDVAPRRIYVGGTDLGAAVALKLAARKDASGVVAMATLPDMAEAVEDKLKGIPVGFVLRDRFEVEPILPTIPCEVLFVHGTSDELVSISRIDGFAAKVGKARVLRVDAARHGNIIHCLSKDHWQEIATFVFEGM